MTLFFFHLQFVEGGAAGKQIVGQMSEFVAI